MPDEGGKLDLGDENVRRLLTVLSQDDDVRSRFQQDPAAVLEEYGIEVDPGEIPSEVSLPSKQDIEAMLGGRHPQSGFHFWGGFPPGPPRRP